MKTISIRRDYVAPHLIPRRYKNTPDLIYFEYATFDVDEIAPQVFDDLFEQLTPADALVLTRRRWLTRSEREEIKATTDKTRLFAETKYSRRRVPMIARPTGLRTIGKSSNTVQE